MPLFSVRRFWIPDSFIGFPCTAENFENFNAEVQDLADEGKSTEVDYGMFPKYAIRPGNPTESWESWES